MVAEHEFATPAQPTEPQSQRLTNADFRKLMMTPRVGNSATPFYEQATPTHQRKDTRGKMDPSKAAERRKKKNFYAKMKKEEEDKMAELAAKYRDRALERRDGGDSANTGPADDTATAYRAVAPNARDNHDAAERRRQMIQESKYLGGDMEHTHLVKGLDFALLQKVRSEISSREAELETVQAANINNDQKQEKDESDKVKEEEVEKKEEPEIKIETRTILGKNIVRNVFSTEVQKVNELFFPGRMAYVMVWKKKQTRTSQRPQSGAKKDVAINEQKATLSTNDIVINKLTQILSYLRAGSRNKKKKKEKLAMLDADTVIKQEKDDLPIYDDINDYKPRKDDRRGRHDDRRDRRDDYRDRRDDRRGGDRDRDRDRDRHRDRDRGDRDRRDDYRDRKERDDRDDHAERRSYFDAPDEQPEKEHKGGFTDQDKQMIKNLLKKEEGKEKAKEDPGSLMSADYGYAECYPGLMEMEDAIGDSDEETDYSKMDMGNKKGPVGRWDFDTPEEYSDYMSSREALPKAAFQYGMKMSDGRKTRGKIGQKNEKAKLDKEWNQISALIEKRKGGGGSGSASKRPKYD